MVLLQRSERAALRARLGAGVQLTQLHEVAVLDQVLAGQAGHHRALLQVAVALRQRAADAGAGAAHLVGQIRQFTQVLLTREVPPFSDTRT